MSPLATRWETLLDRLEERERRRARRLPAWRAQRRHRTLTAAAVTAGLVMVVGAVALRQEDIALSFTLWLGGYLVWLVHSSLPRILTGKVSSTFSVLPAERKREWRHRVSDLGYQVLTVVMLLDMGYRLAMEDQEEAAFHGALIPGCPVHTIILGWALPADDPEGSVA
jgi:hypothetical protein